MKKDTSFYSDEAYTNAFNKIKKYLLNPPSSTGIETPTYPLYCCSNTFLEGVVGTRK
jgi:hypothetical protein